MGSFKLGGMTFGSMFKKPETTLYPFEVKPQPAGLRGHVAIEVEGCILCGICQKTCPCNAIEVAKKERTWTINRYACIQCNMCVNACPKSCLSTQPEYPKAVSAIQRDCVSIPEQ